MEMRTGFRRTRRYQQHFRGLFTVKTKNLKRRRPHPGSAFRRTPSGPQLVLFSFTAIYCYSFKGKTVIIHIIILTNYSFLRILCSSHKNRGCLNNRPRLQVEMTSLNLGRPFHSAATGGNLRRRRPHSSATGLTISCSGSLLTNKFKRAYTSVMIVPTGVGAAIGGYAGDALPVARALASVVDCLISHPNVLNAAMLYWPMPNVLYVEGYALDRFAEGLWGLQPVHQNKVGLVLDSGIEEDLRIRHLQVADATRASLGLPIVEYTVTDAALQVEKWVDPKTGQSTGRIRHPDSLLRAVETLVNRCGVDAVAVVAHFPDDDDSDDDLENYRQGKGIDLLAGVEAVISHLVVQKFGIPCAHAPAMLPFPMSHSLCPKSAAEEIGYTFLPCVLAGLSSAPQYLVQNSNSLGSFGSSVIVASDIDSVILPIDACGGDGALAFARTKTNRPLIIAVEENETVLSDTPDKFGIPALKVSNYWEAIGVIAAHKAGIDPNSLRKDRIGNIGKLSPSLIRTPNGYTTVSGN